MTLHRRCGAGPGGPSRASSGVPDPHAGGRDGR